MEDNPSATKRIREELEVSIQRREARFIENQRILKALQKHSSGVNKSAIIGKSPSWEPCSQPPESYDSGYEAGWHSCRSRRPSSRIERCVSIAKEAEEKKNSGLDTDGGPGTGTTFVKEENKYMDENEKLRTANASLKDNMANLLAKTAQIEAQVKELCAQLKVAEANLRYSDCLTATQSGQIIGNQNGREASPVSLNWSVAGVLLAFMLASWKWFSLPFNQANPVQDGPQGGKVEQDAANKDYGSFGKPIYHNPEPVVQRFLVPSRGTGP